MLSVSDYLWACRFARAFVHEEEFVVAVLGSSVAAGHDNCNYDSYERQLERSFGPALLKGGKSGHAALSSAP